MDNVQFIQSRQNKTVKEIVSLQDKRYRRKQHCFLAEGFRFVQEAIASGMKVDKICFSSDVADKFHSELGPLCKPEIQCFEVSPELFGQLAETDSPQGILAVVHIPDRSLDSLYKKGFRGLLLDNVQDPGNAGTMIRSAHALGFDAVAATSGSVDIYNSKVLRATMGSVFFIPVIDNLTCDEILSFCKKQSLQIFTSRLENAEPCHEVDLTDGFFLVIGNEGNGASEAMISNANGFVYIPMPGGAESFNAAIAASILMYESNRQLFEKGVFQQDMLKNN